MKLYMMKVFCDEKQNRMYSNWWNSVETSVESMQLIDLRNIHTKEEKVAITANEKNGECNYM